MNPSKRCALKTFATAWNFIPWDKVKRIVRSLQRRIAKAISEGKPDKAKASAMVTDALLRSQITGCERE